VKFGFIAHTASKEEIKMLRILDQIKSISLGELFSSNSDKENKYTNSIDFVELNITSKAGANCTGKITYLPLLPEDITEDQDRALEMIIKAAKDLEEWGADIIGLGGYTAVIKGRGKEVQNELTKATITTGNSYTTYTSIEALEYALHKLDLNIQDLNTTIVGFPGSISLAITKILAQKGAKLTLVGRRENLVMKNFLQELDPKIQENISFTLQIKDGVQNADIIMAATSSGSVIESDWLKSGAIVVDIGEPKDVIKKDDMRNDVLILDGGRFDIEDEVSIEGSLSSFFKTGFFGCVGETVLLTLEGLKENLSMGRVLSIEGIKKIGIIAKKHGFKVTDLHSWGNAIDPSQLEIIKKIICRNNKIGNMGLNTFESVMNSQKDQVWERYKNHVNPVLAAISEAGNYDRTYVKASGINLWDTEGKKYYDFVGGYGSVNIGHNHPKILEGVKRYTEFAPPSLLQVSPGIFATALAENLAMISPGNLESVFFCNSGTEAVEGALKLARIYTGKSKYISTFNSFHGKTYGSLSVTGREKYQKYFKPLLNETIFIPYGDLSSLEEALQNKDVAAFIVEPIQGEGGVIVPEEGYLKKAEELCHKYDALFIVDEVQTGMGRTGKMFAVEHDGAIPDILSVAKSLSGGLIPIGAYITKKEIWEKAYGTQNKYLLHTSTFGGNNFCTSIGLIAMEVITSEKLYENAEIMGRYFIEKLCNLKDKYAFIKDVRGKGLMIGIEFDFPMIGGLDRIKDMITSMIPRNIKSQLLTLPEGLVDKFNDFIEDSKIEIEKNLQENFT
jgi:acetylornithine/succinyldiaminopimelate/putrescine aminotransferase/predicted amino acid dehydrogenase